MKIKSFFIFASIFTANAYAQETWRGLRIEEQNHCSTYKRKDYVYSQVIKDEIIEALGNRIYSPYSGMFFDSKGDVDIEHIVSLSEAHDSGLCFADKETKSRFASDIRNLTLASPKLNRNEKAGYDASAWLPEKNKCWFSKKVIEVKRAYNLTVDSDELVALERLISKCSSFELIFYENNDNLSDLQQQILEQYKYKQLIPPVVKKSRSGICHAYGSSSHYCRTKHFTAYESLELCLNSGGRCPKSDVKCNYLYSFVKH